MTLLPAFQLSAAYNQWANTRLYDACAGLDDADYRRDLGAFFGSIHGTLNHLLLADRLWLGRLQGRIPEFAGFDAELFADRTELRAARTETDTAICLYLDSIGTDSLQHVLRFTSFLGGREMRLPCWVALTQLFNHQLHHRGQVTALLSRLGVDYGDIDLIWMPGSEAGRRTPPAGA